MLPSKPLYTRIIPSALASLALFSSILLLVLAIDLRLEVVSCDFTSLGPHLFDAMLLQVFPILNK